MQFFSSVISFIFSHFFLPVAGNADVGELFGYRLGNVYKPDQAMPDHIDDAYVDLELTKTANKLGVDYLQAVVKVKDCRAHTLIGIKQFNKWDKAKLYASNLGQQFLQDYGGDYWEVLGAEQWPKNDDYPKHIPRVTIVYEQTFDGRYELVVILFHGDRIFSQEPSDPYIEIRYQDLTTDIGHYVYFGSGNE